MHRTEQKNSIPHPELQAFLGKAIELLRSKLDAIIRSYLTQGEPNSKNSKPNENAYHYFSLFGWHHPDDQRVWNPDWSSGVVRAIRKHEIVKDWFVIPERYDEDPIGLIVALHGFWIFWLDETRNRFAFPIPTSVDDVTIRFGNGVRYSKHNGLRDEIMESVIPEYNLKIGGGTAGLSLRLDRGACIGNTISDVRGAVVKEDWITRNMSYIGVPIFGCATAKQNKEVEIGGQKKPILYFSLLFPLSGAWHSNQDLEEHSCLEGECLYSGIHSFCQQDVRDWLEMSSQYMAKTSLQTKVIQLSGLGDESRSGDEKQTRLHFLNKLCENSSWDDSRRDFVTKEFLGIQAASLWERVPDSVRSGSTATRVSTAWGATGLLNEYIDTHSPALDQANPESETPWSSFWNYLKIDHEQTCLDMDHDGWPAKLIIIHNRRTNDLEQLRRPVQDFWLYACREAELMAEREVRPTDDAIGASKPNLSSLISDEVSRHKLQSMVLDYAADRLCETICLGKARAAAQEASAPSISGFFLSKKQEAEELLGRISEIVLNSGGMAYASVLAPEEPALDENSLGYVGLSTGFQERIKHELTVIPFTRLTLARLVHCVRKVMINRGDTQAIILVGGEPGASREKSTLEPLRADCYRPANASGFTVVNMGAFTTLSDPNLFKAWAQDIDRSERQMKAPPGLDAVCIQLHDEVANVILCNARSLKVAKCSPNERAVQVSFTLSWQKSMRRRLRVVATSEARRGTESLAHQFNGRIGNSLSANRTREAVNDIEQHLGIVWEVLQTKCVQRASSKTCLPTCTRIANRWTTNAPHRDCAICPFVDDVNTRKAFIALTRATYEPVPFDPTTISLNTHILSPLVLPSDENRLSGMLVLSTCQREYDTPKRIVFSPEQMDIVHFACDYLEFALSEEQLRDKLRGSLQSFAHSMRRSARGLSSMNAAVDAARRLKKHYDAPGVTPLLDHRPAGWDLESAITGLLYVMKPLQHLDTMHFEHGCLVNALTQVLVGIPELKTTVEHLPPSADNLKTWIEHVSEKCRVHEGGLTEDVEGQPKPLTDKFLVSYGPGWKGASKVTAVPFGSLLVVLEEIFKNARKHAAPGSERNVHFDILEGCRMKMISKNLIGGKASDSTGTGLDLIKRVLRANYGLTGADMDSGREGSEFVVTMVLDCKRYTGGI